MSALDSPIPQKIHLDDTEPLHCKIESAHNVGGHVEYTIKVTRGPLPDRTWVVSKRYSEFSDLNDHLKQSNIELPLPPKKILGNLERDFIAERQQKLQVYLDAVVSHPFLSHHIEVKRFLDPVNYSTNLQEVALQQVSMFFRSDPGFDVVEPLPLIGWRLRKRYLMILPKSEQKKRLMLSWTEYGPDQCLSERDISAMMKLLPSFQHAFLYPVVKGYCNESGGLVIRDFVENGTLLDRICQTKPKQNFLKKYGLQKSYSPLTLAEVKRLGRQILEIVRHLYEKGFHYGHLHAANVLVTEQGCKLIDIENAILGLPGKYRPFAVQLKKIQTLEALDVYGFGHILYQMVCGEPLNSPTCDRFRADLPADVRSVLESILSTEACKGGMPTLADLVASPLFAVALTFDKPQIKIPSKLKESLKVAREAVEKRLHLDQKLFAQIQRRSKVEARHMSEDEKRRRKKEKKKSILTDASDSAEKEKPRSKEQPSAVSSPPSAPTSPLPTSSVPAAPTPPPAPPVPANTAPPPPPASLPEAAPGRTALLSSIQQFKGGLKKTVTKDGSVPKV